MTLVDTTDRVMMLGAYDWAFVKPVRKLYCNMTTTLMSVIVALLIGGLEVLSLVSDRLELSGGLSEAIGTLNENFNNFGFGIIGAFLAAWALSYTWFTASRSLTRWRCR